MEVVCEEITETKVITSPNTSNIFWCNTYTFIEFFYHYYCKKKSILIFLLKILKDFLRFSGKLDIRRPPSLSVLTPY